MKRELLLTALLLGVCTSLLPARQGSPQAAKSDSKMVKVSYYSSKYNGRRTASKEKFSNTELTAAHRELPFGTKVRLTNPANSRTVVVRVNDRGPFIKGREISVTRRAARELGFEKAGLAQLSMTVLGPGQ
jgi:rare lipoprotein A